MLMLHHPLFLKGLTLQNRIVMPPMATAKSTPDGMVSDELCAYYDEKSRGGYIGLIIVEHSFICPEGKASLGQLSMAEDACIPGLKKLVQTIHANNTPVFAQINHAGIQTKRSITGCDVLGPSSVIPPNRPIPEEMPREMTAEDIARIPGLFAASAKRVKEAGFDGVEIHSAHGYLLNQFYSPLTNHRTDSYGGCLMNRIRLHLEVIRAVREAVGEDYPIALRLGASDYMDGGSTIEDGAAACREFQKAGVDLLDISGGFSGYRRPEGASAGYFKDATFAIRKTTRLPIILTGGVTKGDEVEALLCENAADLIGVGRAILADSNWAKNAVQNY